MRIHAIWHKGLNTKQQSATTKRRDILLYDFEKGSYSHWTLTGNAFGKESARGTLPEQGEENGFTGSYLVNSYLNGDASTGIMTSKKFEINRKYLNFLIGGGSHIDKTSLKLIVDGKVVRTATGMESEQLYPGSWDLTEFDGKQGVLKSLTLSQVAGDKFLLTN